MNPKPVFIIATDHQLFLIDYKINSDLSVLTWSPDPFSSFVFFTARRAERIKRKLGSCYQLFVLEAFLIDKTLQVRTNAPVKPNWLPNSL